MGKFAAFLPIFIPAAGGASVPSACKSWDFFASLGDKKRNFPRLSPNRSPSSFSFFRFRRESSFFSSSVRRRNRSRNTGVKTAKRRSVNSPFSPPLLLSPAPLRHKNGRARMVDAAFPTEEPSNASLPPLKRGASFPHGPETATDLSSHKEAPATSRKSLRIHPSDSPSSTPSSFESAPLPVFLHSQ